MKFDIHFRIYGEKRSAEKEGYNIQIPEVIFEKSSQIPIKEAFFRYKMCHDFKSMKVMQENIPYICRPTPSEDLRYISWKSSKRKAS